MSALGQKRTSARHGRLHGWRRGRLPQRYPTAFSTDRARRTTDRDSTTYVFSFTMAASCKGRMSSGATRAVSIQRRHPKLISMGRDGSSNVNGSQ